MAHKGRPPDPLCCEHECGGPQIELALGSGVRDGAIRAYHGFFELEVHALEIPTELLDVLRAFEVAERIGDSNAILAPTTDNTLSVNFASVSLSGPYVHCAGLTPLRGLASGS